MTKNLRTKALLDEIPPESKILDIGCVQHSADKAGNEDWVHGKLYDISENVLGLDYEEEEVNKLRQQGYNIITGNAENLDLDEKFDIVVAGELIEHLSNVGTFLDGVYDHLTPDGELIMTTPNPWAFHRFKQAIFGEVYCNEEHTCWFDNRTIRQALQRHGFKIDKISYIKASDFGITKFLYSLGLRNLGGTSILINAKPIK